MKKIKWLALILIVSLLFGMIACKYSTDAPKAPESHHHTFQQNGQVTKQADTGMNVFVVKGKTLQSILMAYGRYNKNQQKLKRVEMKELVKIVDM